LLVGIKSQYQLIWPALFMGTGHCFIFPSMVDLAAERLPAKQRGMGTSLILGAGDLGLLISYVLLGQIIDAYGFDTGLKLLAAIVLASAIVFAIARREALIRRVWPSIQQQSREYTG
ncbi:MAG: MFS transporter, partial [Phycisphaerae bacterium]